MLCAVLVVHWFGADSEKSSLFQPHDVLLVDGWPNFLARTCPQFPTCYLVPQKKTTFNGTGGLMSLWLVRHNMHNGSWGTGGGNYQAAHDSASRLTGGETEGAISIINVYETTHLQAISSLLGLVSKHLYASSREPKARAKKFRFYSSKFKICSPKVRNHIRIYKWTM